VLASKSADGTDLTKDQKLQMRLEYHRPALEKEAADAKRQKVKNLKRKEEEFELEGWRREWDSANSIEMASREVKRAENFRIVWADEARVSATTDRIRASFLAAKPRHRHRHRRHHHHSGRHRRLLRTRRKERTSIGAFILD